MQWQVLIAGSVVLYAVSVLLQRVLIKRESSHPKAFASVYQLLCGVLIGAYGLATGVLSTSGLTMSIVPLAVSTLSYAAGNVALFQALKHVEASRFTILFALRSVVTVLGAMLLFGEQLTGTQLLGMLLVLAGIAVLHTKALKLRLSKQELPALLAAVFFGIANLSDRLALEHMELYGYVSLAFILPALILFVSDTRALGPIRQLVSWSALKPLVGLAAIYSAGAVLFFAALQTAQTASQVAVANLSSVVLIVLLAAAFLKERTDLARKLVAAVVTFAGLVLIG